MVSMVLAACGQATEAPATEAPATEAPTEAPVATEVPVQDLTINLGTYPDLLDPQKASFVNEIAHIKLVYEGLTRLDANLETVPGAAEKWEYSADLKELTFTLREGLMYSDGTPLNAKRFEYSLLRNLDPAVAGEYSGITDEIVGAAEYRTADLTTVTPEQLEALKAAVGVKALDKAGNACTGYDQADCLTLKITLKQPAPYFHTVMGLWVTYPAKEELITEGGETWWNEAKYHVGNGPMALSILEPSTQAVFVPNENYWRGKAKINVIFKYITDSAVGFEAYKNGEFDIIGLAAEDLATVEADATLNAEKMIYPGSCTYAVYFTSFKEPFTDVKVREAFMYALDREGWVTDVLKGLGSPTLTWIPKGFPGYDADETRYGFDAELAKTTLAESEWVKAGKPLDVTATFSDTPRNRTRWEWLASKWAEVLGVEVKLNPVEATTFTALTKDKATIPQMFILGWCADYPDPQNWLSVYWMSSSPYAARYGYANPDLDVIMQAADVEPDPAKRAQLYADAQKKLVGDAAVAFMWNNVNAYLVKPYVKGITTTPQDSGWPGDVDPLTITIEK